MTDFSWLYQVGPFTGECPRCGYLVWNLGRRISGRCRGCVDDEIPVDPVERSVRALRGVA